jgi:hypothetical protein
LPRHVVVVMVVGPCLRRKHRQCGQQANGHPSRFQMHGRAIPSDVTWAQPA